MTGGQALRDVFKEVESREFDVVRSLRQNSGHDYMAAGVEILRRDGVDSPPWIEGEKAVIGRDPNHASMRQPNSKHTVSCSMADDMGDGFPADFASGQRETGRKNSIWEWQGPLLAIFEIMLAKRANRSEFELSVPKQKDWLVGMEALASRMKSRSVEQPPEHVGHLFLHDSGPIVFDDDEELVFVNSVHFDQDVREYFRLLGGVECVLNSLLDNREERLGRRVVAEDLLVPLEELGDADLALLLREFLRDRDGGHGITGGRR